MEVIALSKNVRISPRKARMVATAISKLPLPVALERLEFLTKKGARPLFLTMRSAVANATKNKQLPMESLRIKNILVDEGFKMKRRDTSHGARFGGGVIQKRASHIKVILEG